MTQPKIVKQAAIAHKQKILAKPNVVGLGVGYKKVAGRMTDELSVVVLVRDKKPPAGCLGFLCSGAHPVLTAPNGHPGRDL